MKSYTSTLSRHRVIGSAAAFAAALALGACDTNKLVTVTDPASLTPSDINNPAATPGLVQGALAQFVGGYSGFGDDAFLSSSGVISDELYYGDTFTTRQAADSRNLQPTALGNISDPAFSRLMQARLNARRAVAQVAKFSTPATASEDSVTRAEMRAIEGYVFVTISEGWCSGVPFSSLPDTGTIDPSAIKYGLPLSTAQMNDSAVVKFDEALQLDPTSYLAMIGKARALLNNGQYAAAAAAVSAVPTSYVFLLEHSTNSSNENNPMAALMGNGRYGISNLEGGQTATGAALRPDLANPAMTATSAEGLPFRGAKDPRIPNEGSKCFTSSINCWLNDNYPDYNADVPLASGVEARLIEAEAALQAGDTATFFQRLNDLRANTTSLLSHLYPGQKQTFFVNGAPAGLGPVTDPANPLDTPQQQFDARRALLFSERAFWLFNTGHRQGDLRRLVRQYGLTSAQAFPSGPFFRGGLTYGNDVAYPVPFNELRNINFSLAACSTTTA
jgi:hypothetical protein